jgi:predicted nucleic acid-binding Zn finger protein
MIEILQEVTDWGKYPVVNGIYHVNSAGQLVQHNDKVFKNPIKQFSKSRRKFTKIGERPEQIDKDIIVVKSSSGKTYTIEDGNCSCPGFTFRGNCKHVKENT